MAPDVTPERAWAVAWEFMNRPQAWGVADCCASACKAFDALWGTSVWAGVPPYSSAFGARRRIAENGGAQACCSGLASKAGLVKAPEHVGALGRFDIGEFPICLGIYLGDKWATMMAGGGVALHSEKPKQVWGAKWA